MKKESIESELVEKMAQNLNLNQSDHNFNPDRASKAIDYLSNAMDLCEDLGLTSQAEAIIVLLEKIAGTTYNKNNFISQNEVIENKKQENQKKYMRHQASDIVSIKRTPIEAVKVAAKKEKHSITVDKLVKNLLQTGAMFPREMFNVDDSNVEDILEQELDILEVSDFEESELETFEDEKD